MHAAASSCRPPPEAHAGDIALPADATLDPRTRDQIQQSIEDDVLQQYIARLQRDLGTSVNRTLLNRAVGGTTQ